MPLEPTITREIAPLPERREDAHKGDVGRLIILGGFGSNDAADVQAPDLMMLGAPALAANAALRSGAGLVQLLVPSDLRSPVLSVAPCATARRLIDNHARILSTIHEFRADVLAIGPGLGRSLSPHTLTEILLHFPGPVVIDADGLNLLAEAPKFAAPNPQRIILTPHVGEAHRLLAARGRDLPIETTAARRDAACTLHEEFQTIVVLKGRGTLVTNGERLYINDTGNPGMATGGTGDVLTGVIAALLGQKMDPFEAAILGVYLHGLAGDFAAEELGRHSMTAQDVIDYLPDAFCDHESATSGPA